MFYHGQRSIPTLISPDLGYIAPDSTYQTKRTNTTKTASLGWGKFIAVTDVTELELYLKKAWNPKNA